jgi:membrane associated rhomboid family serine protease
MVVWLCHARVGHRQGLYPKKASPSGEAFVFVAVAAAIDDRRRLSPRTDSGFILEYPSTATVGVFFGVEYRFHHRGQFVIAYDGWHTAADTCSGERLLFVHVETRRRPRWHWATLLVVTICVMCFVGLALTPATQRVSLLLEWGTVPANIFDPHEALLPQLTDPALLRLFTALFIHVTWLHLLSNLLFLAIFGLPGERALGSLRFLLLFVVGGIVANLIGALSLTGVRLPIIGCSGAVSAVVGTYVALFPRARLGLVLPLGLYLEFVRVPAFLLIGLWVLLQLLFSYAGPSYGAYVWWAHIGGFLFGVVFALFSRDAIARRLRG